MPFSFTRTDRQAECDSHMIQQSWSWLKTISLQTELEHNERLIHEKTELHGQYMPIPFRECRQNLRKQIGSLTERNIQVKAELQKARETRDLAEAEILKCVRDKITHATPPPIQSNLSAYGFKEKKG